MSGRLSPTLWRRGARLNVHVGNHGSERWPLYGSRGASSPSVIDRVRTKHKLVAAFARAVTYPTRSGSLHRAHAVNHAPVTPVYVAAARRRAFTLALIHRLRHGQTILPNPAFERARI